MPTTIVGIVVALIITVAAMTVSGMDPAAVFVGDPMSAALVVVATLGATFASSGMSDVTAGISGGIKTLFASVSFNYQETVDQLAELADKARREGLLAIDKVLSEVEDPFTRRGLQQVVDGSDPADTRDLIELEIEQTASSRRSAAGFWTTAAGYAPAFGVFGTVIGLIDMLNNLADPSNLGPALAVAFVTTLWGVFLANFFFQPLASKMGRDIAMEVAYREMVLEGIMSIQAGANPRSLKEKLTSFIPEGQRGDLAEAA